MAEGGAGGLGAEGAAQDGVRGVLLGCRQDAVGETALGEQFRHAGVNAMKVRYCLSKRNILTYL